MTENAAPYGDQSTCRNGNILLEAHTLVNNDRQDEYGPPAESFGQLAQLWSIYLRHKLKLALTPHDVTMLMTLLKINREAHKHKWDNLIDAAAYLALAADLEGWE